MRAVWAIVCESINERPDATDLIGVGLQMSEPVPLGETLTLPVAVCLAGVTEKTERLFCAVFDPDGVQVGWRDDIMVSGTPRDDLPGIPSDIELFKVTGLDVVVQVEKTGNYRFTFSTEAAPMAAEVSYFVVERPDDDPAL
jgi:hypothetical protein